MPRVEQGVNDLYTWCLNNGAFGQQLINEWVGLDETNQQILMDSVARASNKKVKWKCNHGHEWCVAINNRTASKTGCPYCSGNLVSPENSLKTWCLNNGAWGQRLLREWTGLDENNQPLQDLS